MRKTSFFSLLAGIAAGAAIGMLYAPDKGWKTRARVKKAAENGFEDLKDGFADLSGKVDEKASETKESLKSLKETIAAKGEEIKEGTREMLLRQLDRLEAALRKAEGEEEAPAGEEAPAVDEQPQGDE